MRCKRSSVQDDGRREKSVGEGERRDVEEV